MTFNTRKMILAVILVGIMLALFLGFAFRSIQKVSTSFEINTDAQVDSQLAAIADMIIEKSDVAYIDSVTLADIQTDILLVNHQTKAACLIQQQQKLAVEYDSLDASIVNCNQYRLIANGQETMVINCDAILEDPFVRAIAHAYHYAFASTEYLNPASVTHFPTIDQNETTSFYRYAMIESAKQCYTGESSLEQLYNFYDQWVSAQGLDTYQEVIQYDYYDGLYAYGKAKVMMGLDADFDMLAYIESYQNEYGVFPKDMESEVMGLLWCLLATQQGLDVIVDPADTKDIYRKLFEGIALGDLDDTERKADYHEAFSKYMLYIADVTSQHSGDMLSMQAVIPSLTAETYSATIQVDDQYYIYLNYKARKTNNELIEADAVMAKISPYTITLYMNAQ